MKEAAEAHCTKYTAQKARKEAEAKIRKEAKKQKIAEKEEKKKQMEYL